MSRFAVIGAAVALPDRIQPDGVVLVDGPKIVAAGPRSAVEVPRGTEKLDGRGKLLAPGLIDLHLNGFGGIDVFGAEREGLSRMAHALAAAGVTAFVPTVVTSPFPALLRAAARLTTLVSGGPEEGAAEPLGLYLEGPFLSEAKRGAHPSQDLRSPRADTLAQLIELTGELKTRLATIAPELPGALDAIRTLTAAHISVALGHSNADAETCRQAVAAGATHVTHLFNAMGPLHHRSPGLAGFTLGSGEVTAEIVADGHHVDRWMIAAAWRALTADRLALVSDALAPAGLPLANGDTFKLESGLGKIVIRRDSTPGALPRAENASGVLVGSIASLTDCLRFAVQVAEIPLHDAVKMASATPARIAGVSSRKGSIAPGMEADLVLLDERLAPEAVWTRGHRVGEQAGAARRGSRRTRPAPHPRLSSSLRRGRR